MEWAGLQGFKWERKGRGSGACREVVLAALLHLPPFTFIRLKGLALEKLPPLFTYIF